MKVELSEILKIVAGLGGTDASDEYSKGWDEAVDAVYSEINKLGEAESGKLAYDYEHKCIQLKKRLDDLICENKMLRADRENEKEYSSTLESVLKAVNLLTDIVTK